MSLLLEEWAFYNVNSSETSNPHQRTGVCGCKQFNMVLPKDDRIGQATPCNILPQESQKINFKR